MNLIKCSSITLLITSPKKSRGKGSQGNKTADVSQESVDVSEESKPEPAKNGTTKERMILHQVVYNRRTKKIMETMNVTFDELSAMDFKQSSSKPGLKGMPSRQVSSGLDLTYAPSTITTQQPTETPMATTTIVDTAPTPTNSSSQAINFPNTSQDVNELKTQQHVQHQPAIVVDNVPNAMFDENTFVNPFATPSISAAESSSSQYVDLSNMHTFDQPYPYEYQWTKDHPLE
nr:hypothetical protein [Tanacetum cinerariifolium]